MNQNETNAAKHQPSLAAKIVRHLRKHRISFKFIGVFDAYKYGYPNPNVGRTQEDILRRAAANYEASIVIVNDLAILVNAGRFEKVCDRLYRLTALRRYKDRRAFSPSIRIESCTHKLICWCCKKSPFHPQRHIHEIKVVEIREIPRVNK